MTGFRIFARRTTGSGSPPDLQFGEVAYSDTDQQLYVGRSLASPPATFSTLPALSPVATSGAYDDLTGQPALFPGNYSDLAGIPSAFPPLAHSQAASTIAGLAPVATSGVYADLSAKPTIPFGFNYDQTAEPMGLTAGVTWRERSADGKILGDWAWDAVRSLWVSELIFAETTRLTLLTLPTSTHGILLETASLLTFFAAAFTPTVANDVTIQGRIAGDPGGFTMTVFLSPMKLSSTDLSFAQWETYFRTFPVDVLIPVNRLGLYVNGNPAIRQIFNLVVFDIANTGTVPGRTHQASATYRYYR